MSPECPCGRARIGCEYHDPALQPAAVPPDPGLQAEPSTYICLAGVSFRDLSELTVYYPPGSKIVFTAVTDFDKARLRAMFNAFGRASRTWTVTCAAVSSDTAWFERAANLVDGSLRVVVGFR